MKLDMKQLTNDTVTLVSVKEKVNELEYNIEEAEESIEGAEAFLYDYSDKGSLIKAANKITRLKRRLGISNLAIHGVMSNDQLDNAVIAHEIIKDGNEIKEQLLEELEDANVELEDTSHTLGESYTEGFDRISRSLDYYAEMSEFNVLKTKVDALNLTEEDVDEITSDENFATVDAYFVDSVNIINMLKNRVFNNAPIFVVEDNKIVSSYLESLEAILKMFKSDTLFISNIKSDDKVTDLSTHDFKITGIKERHVVRESYNKNFNDRHEYVEFINKFKDIISLLKTNSVYTQSTLDYLNEVSPEETNDYKTILNICNFNRELYAVVLGDYKFVCNNLNDKIEVLVND